MQSCYYLRQALYILGGVCRIFIHHSSYFPYLWLPNIRGNVSKLTKPALKNVLRASCEDVYLKARENSEGSLQHTIKSNDQRPTLKVKSPVKKESCTRNNIKNPAFFLGQPEPGNSASKHDLFGTVKKMVSSRDPLKGWKKWPSKSREIKRSRLESPSWRYFFKRQSWK